MLSGDTCCVCVAALPVGLSVLGLSSWPASSGTQVMGAQSGSQTMGAQVFLATLMYISHRSSHAAGLVSAVLSHRDDHDRDRAR